MAYIGKILVVEDDEISQMIAAHWLEKKGYDVVKARNGKEALESVVEHDFAIVFMDINMPIMDGVEATRLIRGMEKGKALPIIALTAHTNNEYIATFNEIGMTDYMLKPFDSDKLDAVTKKYLV